MSSENMEPVEQPEQATTKIDETERKQAGSGIEETLQELYIGAQQLGLQDDGELKKMFENLDFMTAEVKRKNRVTQLADELVEKLTKMDMTKIEKFIERFCEAAIASFDEKTEDKTEDKDVSALLRRTDVRMLTADMLTADQARKIHFDHLTGQAIKKINETAPHPQSRSVFLEMGKESMEEFCTKFSAEHGFVCKPEEIAGSCVVRISW